MKKALKKSKVTRYLNPPRLMGFLLALSVVIGFAAALVSNANPTQLQISAKNGCSIINTKDGPGCWCAQGDWQWHCGGGTCSQADQNRCASENGANQTENKDSAKDRCKLGEWACGSTCADAGVQKIFNSTWKDGKTQWMFEAGCGEQGSSKPAAKVGAEKGQEICSGNGPTSIGCLSKPVGTSVALSAGKSCTCAFTTKPDCACVIDTTPATPTPRVNRGMQRESTSSFLKDKPTPTPAPTRPADWVKGGERRTVAREEGSGVEICPNRWFTDSCDSQVVGSECTYVPFSFSRNTAAKVGICQHGLFGCSCK